MSAGHWTDDLVRDLASDIRIQTTDAVFVAFSGGLDSTVLLWCAVQALGANRVMAIHINHGLSDHASRWAGHCRAQCAQLGCSYQGVSVDVSNQGQGVEAEARRQRYQAFSSFIPSNGLLLLGHHQDDQVETFFLRLLRGAGAHGLTGIPKSGERDGYRIYRPLLDIPRSSLKAIADNQALTWVEDDSNSDSRFDRNFLRNEILPQIETRWPGYRDRIVQTQSQLRASSEDTRASTEDSQQALQHRLSHDGGLKMVQIDAFSNTQLLSLLHAWLVGLGHQVPSQRRLQAIIDQVVYAQSDAQPQVALGDGSVRRHGPALYWVPNLPLPEAAPAIQLNQPVLWQGVGQVCVYQTDETLPRLRADLPDLHWRLREGGEVMRPLGRSKPRDLKRLLQEYRIKPWLRDRTPLLFSQDQLVAVGDELLAAEYIAQENEPGIRISWQKPEIAD